MAYQSIYDYAASKNNAQQAMMQREETDKQNNGGVAGGIGYLFHKIGLGTLSWAEGVWDFTAGGLASLFGADDWAEQQMKNDWVNYNSADEWYNPSDGWKLAGDVAQGIGNSLPSLAATTAVAILTGGSSLALGATTFLSSGLSAAGQGVNEAYKQTGQLTGKEWAYGIGSGALEGSVETFSDQILGIGSGAVRKAIAGTFGKGVAASVSKETIGKTLGKAFAGEAIEEAVSSFFSPFIARSTYDPNAENATLQEIGYSALVGGLSGLVMGGVGVGINATGNTVRGANISTDAQKTSCLLSLSKDIYDANKNFGADIEALDYQRQTYNDLSESLEKTGGRIETIRQKMLLGQLERANVGVGLSKAIIKQAANIACNADAVAESVTKFYSQTNSENKFSVTADELKSGIDFTSTNGFFKTLQGKLVKDETFRTLAILQTAGQMTMDADTYAGEVLSGNANETTLSRENWLNFLESKTDARAKNDVIRALGIDPGVATSNDIKNAYSRFVENGGVEKYGNQRQLIKKIEGIPEAEAKNRLPATIRTQADGIRRYSQGGADIAIAKTGDEYVIYDYNDKVISRSLSRAEAQNVLNGIRGEIQKQDSYSAVRTALKNGIETASDFANDAAAIDSFAKSSVPEYNNISEANRKYVRDSIRQARAHGISEEDTKVIARVAAKSGLNVVFDRNIGADGMNINNTIYLNPDAPAERLRGKLLIHELDHVLVKGKGGRYLITEAFLNMDAKKRDQIIERYSKFYDGKGLDAAQKIDIFNDEVASAYAEEIATDPAVWDYILSKEPTTKEKVLSFFRKSAQEYSFDDGMSAEARRYLRKFKKLFDSFTERNSQNNSIGMMMEETAENGSNTPKTANSAMLRNVTKVDNDVAGKMDRFSIQDGKVVIDTDQQIFDGVDRKDYGRTVRTYMRLHLRGKEINNTLFTKRSEQEYTHSGYTQSLYGSGNSVYDAKMKASTELDNMVSAGTFLGHEEAKHPHKYNGNGYDRYGITFHLDGEDFSGEMLIAVGEGNRRIFYDIVNIKRGERTFTEEISAPIASASDNSISHFHEDVNANSKNLGNKRTRETTSEGAVGKTDRLTESGITGSETDSPVSPDAARKTGGKSERGAIGSEVGKAHTAQNRSADASTTDIISEKTSGVNPSAKNAGEKIAEKNGEIVRFALPETIEQDVTKKYGKTYRWNETGYILQDGTRLDLSGRRDGAPGGYRTMDHRDIFADLGEDSGTDAMIAFMSRGNIRVSPELPGINLQVEPTAAQYEKIADLVERLGWKEKSFSVDFDNQSGETVDTLNYEGNVSARKVVSDIRYYFKEGKVPQTSDLAKFRYALPETDSDGNTLSEQQRRFFSESAIKAVQDDGSLRISSDGALMPVYHGTNNGEFYEFDKKLAGSSNDAGWYGKGFYFAFRKGEAEYYGKRILECYLNIKNPFIFDSEMQSYDGVTSGDILFDFASFVLNMAEKFPDIAKKLTVDVAEYSSEDSSAVSKKNFVDLAAEMKEIYNSNRLSIVEVSDERHGDHYEYRIDNDVESMDIPQKLKKVIQEQYINSASWAEYLLKDGRITREQYEDILDAIEKYGETNFETIYLHSRFETRKMAESHRLSAVLQYLSEKKYGYLEQHIPEHYMERIGNEFSAEIQRRGYDGVLQSLYGDEVVAFDSSQIKLTSNTSPTDSKDIRYALPAVTPVEPTSQEWQPTIDTAEAKKRFPSLWDVTADESETRNPTQIRSTVSTYRKIYDILKAEGFSGKVLDASSGLGYGTRAGIEEYGFKVDDIEPYPDRGYSPKYTDYSALHGKYDVIISNAVLNVLPQDQRDALVVKMGELLADGGRMFVNVRGDDVNTLSSNPSNVKIGNMEWFVSSTGSYQKGFTRNELVAYLKDALGTDFTVQGTTKFGKTAAIITKHENVRYALSTDEHALANYSEKEYNSFGWARAENALSKAELDDLYAKVQARSTLRTFKQSKNGEAIIEVNRKPHTTLDIDNVFVFVKGKKDDFRITRVVRFDVQTETEMDNIRRVLYEGRTCNDTYIRFNEEKGLAREYRREDLQSFAEYSKERTERGASNGETSRGTDTDNRRSAKYRSGYSLHVGEDGKITERYALADDRKEGNLSRGQRAKFIANNTRMRQYSRTDAAETIDSIVDAIGFGDQVFWMKAGLSGKSRSEVISYLFEKLNTTKEGYRAGVALKIADCIIQNAALTEVYNEAAVDGDVLENAVNTVNAIKQYRNRFHLEPIKEEIKYKYGKKANGIFLSWSQKSGGLTADTVAQDLSDYGIHIDAVNEADIFNQIMDTYERAKSLLAEKASKIQLAEYGSAEELAKVRQEIAREILRAYDERGAETKYARLVEKYTQRIDELSARLRESNAYNRAVNTAVDLAGKIKDWKSGAFQNATQLKPDIFKGSIEKLGAIKNRGNLNQAGTRSIIRDLLSWYKSNKSVLDDLGRYSEEIEGIMTSIATGEKVLTDTEQARVNAVRVKCISAGISLDGLTPHEAYAKMREWYTKKNAGAEYNPATKQLLGQLANSNHLTLQDVRGLSIVLAHFKHFVENYNKVFRDGKWQDAKPYAQKYVSQLQERKALKLGIFPRVLSSWYAKTFNDPMSLARYMDGYEDGFFSKTMEELRRGAIDASVADMRLRKPMEQFYSKHKNYLKNAEAERVPFLGVELTKREAMQLYMTLHREQAIAGAVLNGFKIRSGVEEIRVNGALADNGLVTMEDVRASAAAMIETLEKSFSEADKAYISIAEGIYEQCRELKRTTDMALYGYSNVTDNYYVPIVRSYMAKSIETDYLWESVSVSNQSFNKDTVKGAKNELIIEPIDTVLSRHISGIAKYSALSTAIDNYNIIYNLDISGNPNKPVAVKTEAPGVWTDGYSYYKNLLDDIKGIGKDRDGLMRTMQALRGGYAKAVLGLNLKVPVTQFSSIAAASSILDFKSLLLGMKVDASDVDTYCPLAEVRNYDQTAFKAQGVLDKVGGVGNTLMKPIGAVDRFVIKRLFGACQVQIEADGGAEIGSKENKIAAGKLLERVIVETQQNSAATERSAAMRSGNEFYRTVTMFTADAMKVGGRVIDSLGETTILRAKLKAATDAEVRAELTSRLKTANHKLRKAVGALVASSVFMALVAQGFRWLYRKDDEDDNIPLNMTVDAVGNLMGGLPLVKDVYSFFADGYDISAPTYDMINSLLTSSKSVVTVCGNVVSGNGDAKETAGAVKNLIFSASQFLGLPTRNAYKFAYGITNRISPETAYKIDDLFYDKNYRSDLAKAVENDDDRMTDTLLSLLGGETVGAFKSIETRDTIKHLLKAGYSVLPKSIGDSITYGGEIIELDAAGKAAFRQVYSEASPVVEKMIASSMFRALGEQEQAKAIKQVYDAYYEKAAHATIGVQTDNKTIILGKYMDIGKLAMSNAAISSLESDKDKSGKTVQGSKKKKIMRYLMRQQMTDTERLLILYSMGYTLSDGEYRGWSTGNIKKRLLRFILSKSSATAEEKAYLAQMCGFTVKNGKIVASSLS